MSDKEIERRIETALASGEAKTLYCEACGSRECSPYRRAEEPDQKPVIYCDECADEISHLIIPSSEYHAN